MRFRAFGSMLAATGFAVLLGGPALAEHHGDDHHGDDHHGGGYHGWDYHGGRYGHPFGPYDIERWHGGGWRHEWHNGRIGWWWVVGPSWYYYPAPVYPYPSPYVPPSIPAPVGSVWYWCPAPAGYYPYVGQCSVPWQVVTPR